jgi:hypothetical protein
MIRGYVSVMLWPVVTSPVAIIVGLPFALAFAVRWIHYWLAASATLDLRADWYRSLSRSVGALAFRWLPLLFRACLVYLVLSRALSSFADFGVRVDHFAVLGFPLPVVVTGLFTLIEIAGVVLVGLGILGRYAAFALLFPVLLPVLAGDWGVVQGAALLSVILVLIFDTGAYSLWLPEDSVFRRRPGLGRRLRGIGAQASSLPAGIAGSCCADGCPSEEE